MTMILRWQILEWPSGSLTSRWPPPEVPACHLSCFGTAAAGEALEPAHCLLLILLKTCKLAQPSPFPRSTQIMTRGYPPLSLDWLSPRDLFPSGRRRGMLTPRTGKEVSRITGPTVTAVYSPTITKIVSLSTKLRL